MGALASYPLNIYVHELVMLSALVRDAFFVVATELTITQSA